LPLTPIDIEEIEAKYLELIENVLNNQLSEVLEGLRSRIRYIYDWYPQFRSTAGKTLSDLINGAERVFSHVFSNSTLNWRPLSVPVGSDLVFEVDDGIIHIEIKSALITNQSDYKGVINIREDQTSYPANVPPPPFSPKLPTYYGRGSKYEKLCLTYSILIIAEDAQKIIHNNLDQNPIAILLFSIPNGELYEFYRNDVVRVGKSGKGGNRRTDFRYNYKNDFIFRVLSNREGKEVYRMRVIWLNPSDDYANYLPTTSYHGQQAWTLDTLTGIGNLLCIKKGVRYTLVKAVQSLHTSL